jgi:putative ABC transport system ATP-binding protein
MTAETAIDARGLVKRALVGAETIYPLAGIDLSVRRGDLVLVLGRSGSGKTTLLSILGGLALPDEGKVSVLGREMTSMNARDRRALVREEIGFVFQAAGLIPSLTAEENVAFALYMLGQDGPKVTERSVAALDGVGLKSRSHHRADELSGGEQQRVALARALVKDPRLLLADEPTSQLDAESGKAIADLLKEAAQGGTTVLVAAHDPSLGEVADQLVHLRDGRIS